MGKCRRRKKRVRLYARKSSMQEEFSEAMYPLGESVNVFLLFMCASQDFEGALAEMETRKRGKGVRMTLLDTFNHRVFILFFFEHCIVYYFDGHMHQFFHGNTVRYLYYLMSMMNYPWTERVLRTVYYNKVPRLERMLLLKTFPVLRDSGESMLRRHLQKPAQFGRHLCWSGKIMNATQYLNCFKRVLQRYGTRNVQNIIGWGPRTEYARRQTIYMHDFYMQGMYSNLFNRLMLCLFLVMEAVLDGDTHRWVSLDQETHYCRVEGYHLYLCRRGFVNDVRIHVCLDSQVNKAMYHHHLGGRCHGFVVNHNSQMDGYWRSLFHYFVENFILPRFYMPRGGGPPSLKSLARTTVFCNLFFARVHLFTLLNLKTRIAREFSERWENLRPVKELGRRMVREAHDLCASYASSCREHGVDRRGLRDDVLSQVRAECRKASGMQLLYTFSVLKFNGEYKRRALPARMDDLGPPSL